ncbi:MAG: hypothetical protein H7175_19695 [Burkholderiales bacterium]|nr:hypothetical protein [Anaerolineae bacterium]
MMVESRIQSAMERLYEDMSLRDELTDDEANALLKWGEEEITRLASDSANADESAFDNAMSSLRKVLGGLNRIVGRGADMPAEQQAAAAQDVAASAQALGYTVSAGDVTMPIQAQAAAGGEPDRIGAIQALTLLIKSAGAAAQAQSVAASTELTPTSPAEEVAGLLPEHTETEADDELGDRKSRFMAKPEEMLFLPPEEAAARRQKLKAEIAVRREEMLQEDTEKRAAEAGEQAENGGDDQTANHK